VPTSVDRGVSHGQHAGFPTAVNLSFLHQINKCKTSYYSIIPVVNGLSDHDAQLLLNNFTTQDSKGLCYSKRQINRMNIENFMFKLSFETWDEVYTDGGEDNIFNSFLNTYLRVF
jgi:hypothetical protein